MPFGVKSVRATAGAGKSAFPRPTWSPWIRSSCCPGQEFSRRGCRSPGTRWERLRGERKFAGARALVAQLEKDRRMAKGVLEQD